VPATLTRAVSFRAVHRLYRREWSDEQNRAAFGPLADPPGHPHDYRCAVTVSGALDPETGMVVDLALLDAVLREEVVAPLDGRHLNHDVPAFAGGRPLPTCEALAAYLYGRIAARLPAGVALDRVRVMEDPTLYADCTGLP
jgi:6-pyruvoyltetrahydropterin/6-carboxytetrahydropterin synthase